MRHRRRWAAGQDPRREVVLDREIGIGTDTVETETGTETGIDETAKGVGAAAAVAVTETVETRGTMQGNGNKKQGKLMKSSLAR